LVRPLRSPPSICLMPQGNLLVRPLRSPLTISLIAKRTLALSHTYTHTRPHTLTFAAHTRADHREGGRGRASKQRAAEEGQGRAGSRNTREGEVRGEKEREREREREQERTRRK
jgi:hypothetical protein